MLNAPIRILIVAALCVLGLIGLVVRESMARASGTEVLLAMEAVDPRSLLSGHYVILAITESLPSEQECGSTAATETDYLVAAENRWLALRLEGDIYRLAGVAATREEALQAGPVAVLGATSCTPRLVDENGAVVRPATVRLDLGINRFHINQTDAERIDALLRAQTSGAEQHIFAIVSVGTDGRARLKGLMVDGERLELNWL